MLGLRADARIPEIEHERAKTDREGIYSADVVLVPLEDGDRCEELVKMGKKVVAIDLNPLSRTSQQATVSIVDDLERALKNLINLISAVKNQKNQKKRRQELKKRGQELKRRGQGEEEEGLSVVLGGYDNKANLREAVKEIVKRLKEDAEGVQAVPGA